MIDELIEYALQLINRKYSSVNVFAPDLNLIDRGVYKTDPLALINDEDEMVHRLSESQIQIPRVKRSLLRLYHYGRNDAVDTEIAAWKEANPGTFRQLRASLELRDIIFRASLRVHLAGLTRYMQTARGELRLSNIVFGYANRLAKQWLVNPEDEDTMLDYTAIPWLLLFTLDSKGLIYIRKTMKKKGQRYVPHHTIFLKDEFLNLIPSLVAEDRTRLVSLDPLDPPRNWNDTVSGAFVVARSDKKRAELIRETGDLMDTVAGQAFQRLQETPYAINEPMLQIIRQLICVYDAGHKTPLAFDTDKLSKTAKSLMRSALITTLNIADAVGDSVFYTPMFFDFRGRMYKAVMSLNDQLDDSNKSLLLIADRPALGENGAFYLFLHASNCWGNDKARLEDRVAFTKQHLDEWIAYAEEPLNNTGWFQADAPFSFLAVCLELRNLREWVKAGYEVEDFRSGIVVYFDGSNNGLQHMAAMLRDAHLGKLVNLTEEEDNQDGYAYIASRLFHDFEVEVDALGESQLQELREAFEAFRILFDDFTATLEACEDIEEAKAIKNERKELYLESKPAIKEYAPAHWLEVADTLKKRRKLVKRGVMTLGYGVTVGGMAQQVVDDFNEDELARTEVLLRDWFGRRLFQVCERDLRAVTVVREVLATAVARNAEPVIQWISPSGFPVVMYAYKTDDRDLELENFEEGRLGNITISRIVTVEEFKRSAAVNGISPNVVHSLDAAHLASVVASANFPMTTIHDSFGAAPGNADDLFYLVRQKFQEMYSQDVFENILTQLGHPDLVPEYGDLDLSAVNRSEYSFA